MLITISIISISNNAKADEQSDYRQKMLDAYFSVVLIRGYNETGGLAYGSGVVLDKNKVITNCHIFRTTKEPWVSRGEDKYEIYTVKADTWRDLCLVTTAPLPFKPAMIGNSTALARGQEILAIGHSNGVPAPLTSRGEIKGLYPQTQGNISRTNAKFTMGASGSGLFDNEGKLIGINTFKTAGRNNSAHFALPIEWLVDLEKQPETKKFPIVGKALWEEDEEKKPFFMQAAVPETRGDWQKLRAIAEKWTIQEPSSPEAWYALGLADEKLLLTQEAKQAYQACQKLDAKNPDVIAKLKMLSE